MEECLQDCHEANHAKGLVPGDFKSYQTMIKVHTLKILLTLPIQKASNCVQNPGLPVTYAFQKAAYPIKSTMLKVLSLVMISHKKLR